MSKTTDIIFIHTPYNILLYSHQLKQHNSYQLSPKPNSIFPIPSQYLIFHIINLSISTLFLFNLLPIILYYKFTMQILPSYYKKVQLGKKLQNDFWSKIIFFWTSADSLLARSRRCLNLDYILILLMPKTRQENKNQWQDYLFKMKASNDDCYYQQLIKVKFCIDNPKTPGNSAKKLYQAPVYNNDRISSTPAFILRSELDKFKPTLNIFGNDYAEKYYNIAEQKSELLMPKPSSKSFYCNVCKQKYEDYRQHIESQRHKHKIQSNPFNRHILKLASKYERPRNFCIKQKQANLPTVSELSNVIVIDKDSFDQKEMSKPKKRVKLSERQIEGKPIALNMSEIPFYNNCYQPTQYGGNLEKVYQFYGNFNPFINLQAQPGFFQPIFPLISLNHDENKSYYGQPLNLIYHPFNQFVQPFPAPFRQVRRRKEEKPECIVIDDN